MSYKRINILIPIELYKEFAKLFPYRGELTAFVKRCIAKAVLYRRQLENSDVADVLDGIRKERDDG